MRPQSNPLSVGDTNFFGVRNAERTTKQRRESYKSQKPKASAAENSERLPSTCTPLGSATAEASPPSLGLCRHYLKGYCRNGNKCRWSHVAEEAPTEEAPVARSRCCFCYKSLTKNHIEQHCWSNPIWRPTSEEETTAESSYFGSGTRARSRSPQRPIPQARTNAGGDPRDNRQPRWTPMNPSPAQF